MFVFLHLRVCLFTHFFCGSDISFLFYIYFVINQLGRSSVNWSTLPYVKKTPWRLCVLFNLYIQLIGWWEYTTNTHWVDNCPINLNCLTNSFPLLSHTWQWLCHCVTHIETKTRNKSVTTTLYRQLQKVISCKTWYLFRTPAITHYMGH